ncbi:zinc finger protein [Capsaspora owczarzaki ATCC 30864]|uniref:Zinc finger protein n=1 Tax=Capsaspora owczarzaki (strain ATCC 30864) TaxID=595528 RepID=A0A0D2X2H4_CAPO3|nr:zinc finger protein [Capsaspora owczarzaki ATCC 30864]KJE92564.1 zinc finger protein [Capsaspora owczarzaki ATCC 30864]|eukprot:XP_004348413.1 zinc finger protein [Capsaspora owczarzaki ATCC 30864]
MLSRLRDLFTVQVPVSNLFDSADLSLLPCDPSNHPLNNRVTSPSALHTTAIPSATSATSLSLSSSSGALICESSATHAPMSSSSGRGAPALKSTTLAGVAEFMKTKNCRNVIVMSGAGISTSAGIPDFRSPGTGLYDNLQKYGLPHPQAIFELDYFRKRPEPFFTLARELFPGMFKPTTSHYFVRLLERKGFLLRHYTQNIDTLERVAGIAANKLVEAHGSFSGNHCINPACRKSFDQLWMEDLVFAGKIPRCDKCEDLVKPDIVFFGEKLPDRFHKLVNEDFGACDLLIVAGTSLVVQPFASLIDLVGQRTPRLLINREKVGQADPMERMLGYRGGLDFDSIENVRDVAHLASCDDGFLELARLLGWEQELVSLVRDDHERLAAAAVQTSAQRQARRMSAADHQMAAGETEKAVDTITAALVGMTVAENAAEASHAEEARSATGRHALGGAGSADIALKQTASEIASVVAHAVQAADASEPAAPAPSK